VVVDPRAGGHQAIAYEYRANGETFHRKGALGYGNPNYYHLKRGDSIRVWYLRDNPGASITGEPHLERRNELMTWIVGPFWFGLFYAFLIWRELRKRDRAVIPASSPRPRADTSPPAAS
jgi:hypothetical protein